MTTPPKFKTPAPGARAHPPSPLRQVFGKNLARAREEAGLSQRALARLASVSQRHISLIEIDGANVTIDIITELARHVNKDPLELLTPPNPDA